MREQILPLPKFTLKEKEITKNIRSYLRIRGIFHFKVHQGLGSFPGVSDILGCWRGRMLAIEIKTIRGTVSPQQQAFLRAITANGGLAVVARSVEDVIESLK
jgi:hypothetical protein